MKTAHGTQSLRRRVTRLASIALGLMLVPVIAMAQGPVFGPETYERTTGATDSYSADFAAAPGLYLMRVINGDDDGAQVSVATILLNGNQVVGPADLDIDDEDLTKAVALAPGSNTLDVVLEGDPGSYITVVIVPISYRGKFIAGRLILPYGKDNGLQLEMHNASPTFGRSYRVLFFNSDGTLGAFSARGNLAPLASISGPVADFLDYGSWSEGAVAVVYSGRAGGRLFGQATVEDPASGEISMVELQRGGTLVVDITPVKLKKLKKK